MSELLDIARRYVAAGLSVIPIAHGDKHPDHRRLEATTGITTNWAPTESRAAWRTYCARIAADDELRTWFADGETGIGIVGGQISGGLVRIDFEHPSCLPTWRLAIEWVQPGGTKVVDLLPTVETGKGHHVYFRMPDPPGHVLLSSFGIGNEQLVLAETQGEGCYCVAPPSAVPGSYDWPPDAERWRYTKQYQWIAGDLQAIPTFSQELGNLLLDQARLSMFLEAEIKDMSGGKIKVSRNGLLLHRTVGGRYEDWYLPWESVHTLRSYFERYAALLHAVETAPPPPPSYDIYDDDRADDEEDWN